MKQKILLITALTLLSALNSHADVLELKNGKSLKGKYVGGTAETIRFETSEGFQAIETGQVLALTFTGGTSPAPVKAAPAPAAAPKSTAGSTSISIPVGTSLLVRMVDPVSSKDSAGKRFTSTLESDLVVNGVVIAKAGTKVYGRVQSSQQARRFVGQSALDLRLTEIAMGPTLVPIMTSGYIDTGSKSVRKTARGAAAGATIGAIADGGEGAGKGAAIGAVASGIKKGETIGVSPGTLLEFQLQQPLSVTVSK